LRGRFYGFWEEYAEQKEIPLAVLRYEDLVSDPQRALAQVLTAMRLELSEEEVRGAAEWARHLHETMTVTRPLSTCTGALHTGWGVPAYANPERCGPNVTPEEVALLESDPVLRARLAQYGYHTLPPGTRRGVDSESVAEHGPAAPAAAPQAPT
jgi:hypothetical protein